MNINTAIGNPTSKGRGPKHTHRNTTHNQSTHLNKPELLKLHRPLPQQSPDIQTLFHTVLECTISSYATCCEQLALTFAPLGFFQKKLPFVFSGYCCLNTYTLKDEGKIIYTTDIDITRHKRKLAQLALYQ